MAEGGKKLAKVKTQVAQAVKPGVTGKQLDQLATKLILAAGGKPSFQMVPGYRWATCINVNDAVVHGIPNDKKLKIGDVVGIDVGMYYKGFHTDTSITVPVGSPSKSVQKFLEVGKKGLNMAISLAKPGRKIGDLSLAMQTSIDMGDYSPVTALTGHGIGKQLHEEPSIPCFVVGSIANSPKIVPGMVLAIEIMYNQGGSEVVYQNEDGWTIATADGKISGLFEETVAVTATGPVVLTTT